MADFLANYTMDSKQTWTDVFEWPLAEATLDQCNLVIHSDGGTRHGRCSAAAWVVEAVLVVHGVWISELIAMGGTYFDSPISSFCAEALALEECTLLVKRILERGVGEGSLGKRRKMQV